MEKINRYVIFDTATGSFNMGDYIIYESAIKHLKDFINDGFVLDISTHTPIAHFYQQRKGTFRTKYYDEAKYKFLLGTNILRTNMLHLNPDWNVNIFNCKYYKNTILVGCGLAGKKEKVNWYSKMLYKKILRKDVIHSVRDDETKKFLESIGFKAINTGCPTLWDLDDETCKKIEQNKSDSVVFTLTDYCRDKVQDQKLIDILQKNYKEIYFWIQGSDDMEYLRTFKNISNIKYINNIIFILFMNTKSDIKFKILMIIYITMWLIHDIYIKSYVTAIFDFMTIITSFITIFRIKNSNKSTK